MSIVVITTNQTTRRELCEDCPHCRMANVPKAGVSFISSPDDIDELPTCSLKYHMTCQMKAALSDKAATCPHPDAERAVTWNAATCDTSTRCSDARATQQGREIMPDADQPTGLGPANPTTPRTPSPMRGTPTNPYKVRNGKRATYND